MENLEQYIKDLDRGQKDRTADIKKFGKGFVDRYKFKDERGVRYNVCSLDAMFDQLKKSCGDCPQTEKTVL